MSFMNYMQSLWGPASSSAPPPGGPAPSGGGGFFASSSTTATQGSSAQQLGSGVWPLSAQVREEMKKGTRYNMKVVLRGTKATGKSTLLARLTGHPLPRTYTPSTELVASTMRLQGEHSAPHEGIKVDIWEVVEEGRQRAASSSSPNTQAKSARHIPAAQLQEALRVAADARLLDVYSGAHLTIFLIDPRQRASWEYAKQETLHVPPTCCVLYAVNFRDVTAPASAAAPPLPVTMEEIQAWCARVRRATTGVVHRMLEGRPAPHEFSVPPMTANLSALSGVGIMGVVRALHVASTLLRIAAEEVRVARLFELMARQQAVEIRDEATSPQPSPVPPTAATSGGAVLGNGAVTATAATTAAATSEIAAQAVGNTGGAATAPTASANNTAALRLEHRAITTAGAAASSSSQSAGDPRGGSASAPLTGAAPPHPPMSEAEAMRLFLGGDGSSSDASARSSRSSSASTISFNGKVAPRSVTAGGAAKPLSRPSAPIKSIATLSKTSAGAGQRSTGAPPSELIDTPHAGAEPEAPSSARGEEEDGQEAQQLPAEAAALSSTAASLSRPPDEEVVRALAATMVHDAAAPDDDFFQDTHVDTTNSTTTAAEAASPASSAAVKGTGSVPDAPSQNGTMEEKGEREGEGENSDVDAAAAAGPRARPLWTQRVVRRASSTSAAVPPQTSLPGPSSALQKDVSTLLAEMTAALSAEVPVDSAEASAVVPAAVGPEHEAPEEKRSKRKKEKHSSKHHRHSRDGAEEPRKHSRHRKSRDRRSPSAEVTEDKSEVVEDDGSFDLIVT